MRHPRTEPIAPLGLHLSHLFVNNELCRAIRLQLAYPQAKVADFFDRARHRSILHRHFIREPGNLGSNGGLPIVQFLEVRLKAQTLEPMDCLTALNRRRKIACRDSGAEIARVQVAFTSPKVFPERLPPTSIM